MLISGDNKMPYVYVGHPSIYHGKKLFRLLSQLKNCGQGRIIYRSTEQEHPEPSFYRILLAQPEMDSKLEKGRVVAERIFRGKRRLEPFNLSEEAQFPDFKLVPKDQEDEFCRWNEVQDYVHEIDAEVRPKAYEMPPLLKLYVERNRKNLCESAENLVIPAEKVHEGEHRLEDKIESNHLGQYLTDKFATHSDFEVARVPKEWNLRRKNCPVGYRNYLSRIEGTKEYKKWIEQENS